MQAYKRGAPERAHRFGHGQKDTRAMVRIVKRRGDLRLRSMAECAPGFECLRRFMVEARNGPVSVCRFGRAGVVFLENFDAYEALDQGLLDLFI